MYSSVGQAISRSGQEGFPYEGRRVGKSRLRSVTFCLVICSLCVAGRVMCEKVKSGR